MIGTAKILSCFVPWIPTWVVMQVLFNRRSFDVSLAKSRQRTLIWKVQAPKLFGQSAASRFRNTEQQQNHHLCFKWCLPVAMLSLSLSLTSGWCDVRWWLVNNRQNMKNICFFFLFTGRWYRSSFGRSSVLLSSRRRVRRKKNSKGIILVDPTSNIRLSQRLSHACLSTHWFKVKPRKAQYNSCNLLDHKLSYLDNCGKSRANTWINAQTARNVCSY